MPDHPEETPYNMSMSNDKVTVKRQTEFGSRNWGVYRNRVLVEGGFFSREAAEQCADNWRSELAAEQAVYNE